MVIVCLSTNWAHQVNRTLVAVLIFMVVIVVRLQFHLSFSCGPQRKNKLEKVTTRILMDGYIYIYFFNPNGKFSYSAAH